MLQHIVLLITALTGPLKKLIENRRKTMGDAVIIRAATRSDAAALLEIYGPYVKNTAVTFEYDVPSLEEFTGRIQKTLQKYPYLVAEKDGEILGYAYTGPFVARAAYDWAVEVSIYLKENQRKMGLGKKLYAAIEEISKSQNVLNLNACIGYPEVEDEYLTRNSAQFHEHLGYRMVGEFHHCGYKFGRWYNMVWMEKIIGVHSAVPSPLIRFPDLPAEVWKGIGIG